jgi:hypothetical protein
VLDTWILILRGSNPMKRLVVDSNYLQDGRLRKYLAESSDHFAVLTDYAAMEAHKGDTLNSIFRSMDILTEYPRQVLILHGTQHACGLTGLANEVWPKMIDPEQTETFPEYCALLKRAKQGDLFLQRQLLENGCEADAHMARMLADARDLSDVFEGIRTTFTADELQQLRQKDRPYEKSLLVKTTNHVMTMAAILLRNHPEVQTFPDAREAPDRFIFRVSLCCFLFALRWIAVGGAAKVKPERLRNDMVDVNFAAFATYFDGLLTADKKLTSLYLEACIWLERAFSVRGPLVG